MPGLKSTGSVQDPRAAGRTNPLISSNSQEQFPDGTWVAMETISFVSCTIVYISKSFPSWRRTPLPDNDSCSHWARQDGLCSLSPEQLEQGVSPPGAGFGSVTALSRGVHPTVGIPAGGTAKTTQRCTHPSPLLTAALKVKQTGSAPQETGIRVCSQTLRGLQCPISINSWHTQRFTPISIWPPFPEARPTGDEGLMWGWEHQDTPSASTRISHITLAKVILCPQFPFPHEQGNGIHLLQVF